MNYFIIIIQVIISILLSVTILLQAKGAGLGSAFGGTNSFQHSRRGADKLLFNATIILTILFVATSIANILLS